MFTVTSSGGIKDPFGFGTVCGIPVGMFPKMYDNLVTPLLTNFASYIDTFRDSGGFCQVDPS